MIHPFLGPRALVLATILSLAAVHPTAAQSVADFYKGKTLQFIVGYEPSGGYDAYTRAAARFIGKYISGNPTVIVNNMPGASSLTFVRYLQTRAPKDGTQFGMFDRGLISKSVLDPTRVGIDFRDFTWIGSMNSEVGVCFLWSARGITSIAEVMKASATINIGATSKNSGGYTYASIVRNMSPQNVKIALGYASTGQLWLATERGEIDGNCQSYGSLQTQRPEWLADKKIKVMVQFAETKHPNLPDVQTVYEVLRSENEKKAVAFLTAAEEIGRPVIGPPGMHAERTEAIRKAFMSTMKDPEFLAFAKQAKMDIAPIDGPRAAKVATDIVTTPPEAIDLARKLMD